MSRKLQVASYKLYASMTEPKATSCKVHAWNSQLMVECKSLRLAFELEAHLLILQQQRWFRKDKIETRLTLTIEEQKMLTMFIARL